MMLLIVRMISALTALIIVVNIVVGAMTDPDFLVPDWILAALTLGAAVCPKRLAPLALISAISFALGVFSVALTSQILDGQANPGLIVIMIFDLAALAFAARLVLEPQP